MEDAVFHLSMDTAVAAVSPNGWYLCTVHRGTAVYFRNVRDTCSTTPASSVTLPSPMRRPPPPATGPAAAGTTERKRPIGRGSAPVIGVFHAPDEVAAVVWSPDSTMVALWLERAASIIVVSTLHLAPPPSATAAARVERAAADAALGWASDEKHALMHRGATFNGVAPSGTSYPIGVDYGSAGGHHYQKHKSVSGPASAAAQEKLTAGGGGVAAVNGGAPCLLQINAGLDGVRQLWWHPSSRAVYWSGQAQCHVCSLVDAASMTLDYPVKVLAAGTSTAAAGAGGDFGAGNPTLGQQRQIPAGRSVRTRLDHTAIEVGGLVLDGNGGLVGASSAGVSVAAAPPGVPAHFSTAPTATSPHSKPSSASRMASVSSHPTPFSRSPHGAAALVSFVWRELDELSTDGGAEGNDHSMGSPLNRSATITTPARPSSRRTSHAAGEAAAERALFMCAVSPCAVPLDGEGNETRDAFDTAAFPPPGNLTTEYFHVYCGATHEVVASFPLAWPTQFTRQSAREYLVTITEERRHLQLMRNGSKNATNGSRATAHRNHQTSDSLAAGDLWEAMQRRFDAVDTLRFGSDTGVEWRTSAFAVARDFATFYDADAMRLIVTTLDGSEVLLQVSRVLSYAVVEAAPAIAVTVAVPAGLPEYSTQSPADAGAGSDTLFAWFAWVPTARSFVRRSTFSLTSVAIPHAASGVRGDGVVESEAAAAAAAAGDDAALYAIHATAAAAAAWQYTCDLPPIVLTEQRHAPEDGSAATTGTRSYSVVELPEDALTAAVALVKPVTASLRDSTICASRRYALHHMAHDPALRSNVQAALRRLAHSTGVRPAFCPTASPPGLTASAFALDQMQRHPSPFAAAAEMIHNPSTIDATTLLTAFRDKSAIAVASCSHGASFLLAVVVPQLPTTVAVIECRVAPPLDTHTTTGDFRSSDAGSPLVSVAAMMHHEAPVTFLSWRPQPAPSAGGASQPQPQPQLLIGTESHDGVLFSWCPDSALCIAFPPSVRLSASSPAGATAAAARRAAVAQERLAARRRQLQQLRRTIALGRAQSALLEGQRETTSVPAAAGPAGASTASRADNAARPTVEAAATASIVLGLDEELERLMEAEVALDQSQGGVALPLGSVNFGGFRIATGAWTENGASLLLYDVVRQAMTVMSVE